MTLVVKIPLYLELIRFLYFVVNWQVESSLFTSPPSHATSSSFVIACTDGRDIVESANKGMKVFEVRNRV